MENKLWCFVSMALIAVGSVTTSYAKDDGKTPIQFIPVEDVQINDAFWTPKFDRWNSVTVPDVFDKFEGKHLKTAEEQNNNNIFNCSKSIYGCFFISTNIWNARNSKKRQTIIIIDSRSISFHNAINRCNNRKFNNKQNSNKY